MKKLDIKALAIAIGLSFSVGAMAQMSNDQNKSRVDGKGAVGAQGQPGQGSPANAGSTAEPLGPSNTGALKDAQSAQRDRDYAAAKQKCDAMASGPKVDCMTDAKTRYGKT